MLGALPALFPRKVPARLLLRPWSCSWKPGGTSRALGGGLLALFLTCPRMEAPSLPLPSSEGSQS